MKQDDTLFTLHRGNAPLLVSLPHVGRHIPPALQPLYTERALQVEDTARGEPDRAAPLTLRDRPQPPT
jgi:N-formylglutamate amidohydrolase